MAIEPSNFSIDCVSEVVVIPVFPLWQFVSREPVSAVVSLELSLLEADITDCFDRDPSLLTVLLILLYCRLSVLTGLIT